MIIMMTVIKMKMKMKTKTKIKTKMIKMMKMKMVKMNVKMLMMTMKKVGDDDSYLVIKVTATESFEYCTTCLKRLSNRWERQSCQAWWETLNYLQELWSKFLLSLPRHCEKPLSDYKTHKSVHFICDLPTEGEPVVSYYFKISFLLS